MKKMTGGMMYKQKDIILIPFPYTDLTANKLRPAVIISNHSNQSKDDVICCLITSKKPDYGINIQNNNLEQGKLPFTSWIKPNRIFTVHKKIIQKKVSQINSTLHKEMLNEITSFLKED